MLYSVCVHIVVAGFTIEYGETDWWFELVGNADLLHPARVGVLNVQVHGRFNIAQPINIFENCSFVGDRYVVPGWSLLLREQIEAEQAIFRMTVASGFVRVVKRLVCVTILCHVVWGGRVFICFGAPTWESYSRARKQAEKTAQYGS